MDDIYGWNFISDTNDVTDLDGHGTHIAGIIAADEDKDSTFKGIAPNAFLLPCKFTEKGIGQVIRLNLNLICKKREIRYQMQLNVWNIHFTLVLKSFQIHGVVKVPYHFH